MQNEHRYPPPTKKLQKGYIVLAVVLFAVIFVPAVVKKISQQKASATICEISDSLFAQEIANYSDSFHKLQSGRRNNDNSHKESHYPYNTYNKNAAFPRTETKESNTTPHRYNRAPAREDLHFDINKADSIDLVQLRGIGPSYARRIIRYREKLGGYANVEQLQEVYGMTEETYKAIVPHLFTSTRPYRLIDPNTASLQQLRSHPYLNYYQARAIIDWRHKGHSFHYADDLRAIPLLDDSTLARLSPYLTFTTN